MQIYNVDLNMFESDIILEVNFNYASSELRKYSVLDEVTIVGKIDAMENNIVRMIDSNFLSSSNYENNDTYSFDVNENIYLIFGKESTGIPLEILKPHFNNCMRIPMSANVRALNVSNAVAITIYEALRQQNFNDLLREEPHKDKDIILNYKTEDEF